MKKNIITIIIIFALAIGGLLLLQGSANESNDEGTDQNEQTNTTQQSDKLPEFSFENLEGEVVTQADFSGKALVVNSWAVWCPFCRNELPDFAELQKKYPEQLQVIAIDRAEPKEKQISFLEEIDVREELVFLTDTQDSFYRDIGGFTMPETLFVKPNGDILIHKRGFMDIEEMEEKAQQLLEASDL